MVFYLLFERMNISNNCVNCTRHIVYAVSYLKIMMKKNRLITFLNVEKSHGSGKMIPFLELDNGTLIYDQEDILLQTYYYYVN